MKNLQYKILEYLDPQKILSLLKDHVGTIFLDSSQNHEYYGCYSFIVFNPIKTFKPSITESLQLQLAEFETIKKTIQPDNEELPPFIGGLVGYVSYDFNQKLEPVLAKLDISQLKSNYKYGECLKFEIPDEQGHLQSINEKQNQKVQITPLQNLTQDYWFGLYNQVFAFDHIQQQCYLIATKLPGFDGDLLHLLQDMEQVYINAAKLLDKTILPPAQPNVQMQSNFTSAEYLQMVKIAKDYILNGDIFEVNLAQCFSGTIPPDYDSYALYQKLRNINPAPFAAYLNLGKDMCILSASPERFLQVSGNQIEVRPIKGTIKRDVDPKLDRELANQLQHNEKDMAENIMIIDLMRSDLSKICLPNSVNVKQLCKAETFTNLHHLVSVITGELSPEMTDFEIVKACFPGGSVTGAPKIRAMQIINELEKTPREVYCGSIGYFSLNGKIDLSIAIRTLIVKQQTISLHVGGAITLKSDPNEEYQESMLKGQRLLESLAV
jgi:para-aminobenzoate synthetase component I